MIDARLSRDAGHPVGWIWAGRASVLRAVLPQPLDKWWIRDPAADSECWAVYARALANGWIVEVEHRRTVDGVSMSGPTYRDRWTRSDRAEWRDAVGRPMRAPAWVLRAIDELRDGLGDALREAMEESWAEDRAARARLAN